MLVFLGFAIIGLMIFTTGVLVGTRFARERTDTGKQDSVRAKIKAPSLLKEKARIEKKEATTIEDVISQSTEEGQANSENELKKPAAIAKEVHSPETGVTKEAAEKRENTVETPSQSSDTTGTESYFVQIASFQDHTAANKRAGDLSKKGYNVVVVKANIPHKGTWYRVRIGPFENIDKAKTAASGIEKKEKIRTLITKD